MKQFLITALATYLCSFILLGCDGDLPNPQKDKTIYVDSIATNLTSIHDMKVGDSIQFYAYAFPKNAKDTTLVWGSDSSQIVSISENGMAKALHKGWTVLYIHAKRGGFGIGSVMRVSD